MIVSVCLRFIGLINTRIGAAFELFFQPVPCVSCHYVSLLRCIRH